MTYDAGISAQPPGEGTRSGRPDEGICPHGGASAAAAPAVELCHEGWIRCRDLSGAIVYIPARSVDMIRGHPPGGDGSPRTTIFHRYLRVQVAMDTEHVLEVVIEARLEGERRDEDVELIVQDPCEMQDQEGDEDGRE